MNTGLWNQLEILVLGEDGKVIGNSGGRNPRVHDFGPPEPACFGDRFSDACAISELIGIASKAF
jgi:hypothetical protein